jgi:hypothetical protein
MVPIDPLLCPQTFNMVDKETSTGNPNKIRMRCENPWFQHVSTASFPISSPNPLIFGA